MAKHGSRSPKKVQLGARLDQRLHQRLKFSPVGDIQKLIGAGALALLRMPADKQLKLVADLIQFEMDSSAQIERVELPT